MKVAVMQPYIFPYLGYFQLIKAVDVFVIYDDVNFIKQGWINRNKLLINGQENLFTVPIKSISSFESIKDTKINLQVYPKWKKKFKKSIEQNYKSAPYYEKVIDLVEETLTLNSDSISDLAIRSIINCSNYLKLETEFLLSSERFADTSNLDKTLRLIEINRRLNSTDYINPAGGKDLYEKDNFAMENIDLYFIKNFLPKYRQNNNEFISGLSIIDVMMWNDTKTIQKMLTNFKLE